jgi:hypothetical protein
VSAVESPSRPEPVGHDATRVAITQRPATAANGWFGVILVLICGGLTYLFGVHVPGLVWLPILIIVLVCSSLVIVPPGRSSVVQFFGRYIGTVQEPGFWWVAPLTVRRSISLRVRNFETSRLKVNDADGNPVEFAAIVVWQVADTAKSAYAVDSYVDFVSVQAESALRHIAALHPYDDASGTGTSLRGSTDMVMADLATEVAERVATAGVEIVEVRVSHLAYAPEVAQVMLRRQQANAVVAARSRIVEGAVGMVELALNRLSEGGVVTLDEERTASMVSNLMVVLCGDQPTTPIVNAGSLYT